MSAFETTNNDEKLPNSVPVLHESVSIIEGGIPNMAYHQSMRVNSVPAVVSSPTNNVKKPAEEPKQPSDFLFGKCLGEGAYARVVHAKLKKNDNQFAIKIMEKMHIKKENKVIFTSLS